MDVNTKNNIEQAIGKSGFPFENFATTQLRKHGWIVIPNRLYLDDVKGIEREIDILAYKNYYNKKENICYYTGLIISCKKSTENKWCFLTRDSSNDDINVNYFPFHFLTDNDILKYMTYSEMSLIEKKYKANKEINELFSFPKSIISYQVLKGKEFVKNEQIYDSIITSIKALESEKSNLLRIRNGQKKSYKRYYSFYLLSLFDGEMIDCNFDSNGNVAYSNINSILYLNRHIVNKDENFYSVHFISKDVLDKTLSNYDALATLNFQIFPQLIVSFYKDIFKFDEKVKLLWDSFVDKTSYALSYTISKFSKETLEPRISSFKYENGILTLDIMGYGNLNVNEVYNKLNEKNSSAYKTVKKELKTLYRYAGKFEFGDSLPF